MNPSPVAVDPSAVLDQAITALRDPDADLPISDVEQALKVAPGDPRLWHVKGLMHRRVEQRELAIPALQRAAALAPQEPLIAHGLARTLLEAGLPSVDAFARAMQLARNQPDVVRGMIAALAQDGRTSEAIAGLDEVLRRSPLWVEGHTLLAQLRWADGEREGFARSFDEALAAHPNSADLWQQFLTALIQAEQYTDALQRIGDARARFGDRPAFLTSEAAILAELGDTDAADDLFGELADLRLPHVELRRVRHLLRSGRAGEASLLLDQWLDVPEQYMFWPYAATTWRLTGDARAEWLLAHEGLVKVFDLADALPPLEELAATLRSLHRLKGQHLAQSVRGGTQTDGHLFQRIEPQIVQAREAIRRAVEDYARSLPPLPEQHPAVRSRPKRIAFSGAWSVRLTARGFHANHVHPRGWISSALYVVLPDDIGAESAGWLTIGEPDAELRVNLPPLQMIDPKPGRLALFPAWMWHGTRPFGVGERLTVAFDVASGSATPGRS